MAKILREAWRHGALMALLLAGVLLGLKAEDGARTGTPTFYRDVLPVLQEHCQVCHRAGGIAPVAFETYEQTRPYAEAIGQATGGRTMPPWFADKNVGKFSNDPSLSDEQIAMLAAWAKASAPAGEWRDAPAAARWDGRWTIAAPDVELKMPEAVKIPARGEVEYSYEIVPTNFKEGRWVRSSEILPGL